LPQGKPIPLPKITAVLTVCPRRDHDQFEEDLAFTLVSCTIQIQEASGEWMDREFLESFMNEYLSQLADIRQALTYAKYDSSISCSGAFDDKAVTTKSPPWLGPHYSLNCSSHDLDGVPNSETRTPLKVGVKSQSSKLVSQNSSSGGVATVQPGLETPSSIERGLKTKLTAGYGNNGDEGILVVYLIHYSVD
jgi:hypothetical protein